MHNLTPHVYWTPPEERTDRPVLGAVVGQHATLMVDAGNSPAHVRWFLDELAAIGAAPSVKRRDANYAAPSVKRRDANYAAPPGKRRDADYAAPSGKRRDADYAAPSGKRRDANYAAPPRYVALTHWHWDHTFGLQALDIPALAHAETRARLLEMAAWEWSDADIDLRVEQGLEIDFCRVHLKAEWPDRSGLRIRAPDVTYTDELGLDLGGVACRLVHVGGDHSSDSCVVHVPEDGVVFVGDCLYENLHSNPPRYTTGLLFPLLERLLGLGSAWYVLAHNPQPTPRGELEAWAAQLRVIGGVADRVGPERPTVLSELARALGRAPDEEDLRLADLFLAGLG